MTEIGGGLREPTDEQLWSAGEEHVERAEEIWQPLLYTALALFVLDLLLRRVRLFDRSFAR